jgi:RNA polymerase sigma factor for flagellar operon FliA
MATHMKGRLPTSVQLEDLIQAGMIAVLRLVRVGYLARFGEGPLRRSIRNAMIDEARRESWAPVRIIRRAKAAANAMRELEGRLGRHATDEELAAEMALSLAEYHELLVEVAGIRLLELDEIIDREEDLATGTDNPEATLHHDRIVAALAGAVESLPDREKLVVSLYYERNLNMDEVGEILGFDKSTVCRAHGRALLMLRSALQGWK